MPARPRPGLARAAADVTLYTVFGAQGFIGKRLTARLRADGHEVSTPGRGDPAEGRDLGRVIYCAGLTGDYRTRPHDAVEAHVSLLSRILERTRFERLVYLSSTRLYQTAAVGREDALLSIDPNDPEHLYELSKALGENLTLHRSGGRGAVARLSYVFDEQPGATGFLSDWLNRARQGGDIEIASSPTAGRDYIHLDDVVLALRAMADSSANTIINVASGRVTTNAEIAEVFARAGRRVVFTAADQSVETPAIDVARLTQLGVRARPAVELIGAYLGGL
jgi:nucleoside-diphosphate-sugar epimerase